MLKIREILTILKEDGRVLIPGKKTSHSHFRHPTKEGRVSVPYHGANMDVGKFLEKSILAILSK